MRTCIKGKTFFYDRGKEIPMDNTTIEIYYSETSKKIGEGSSDKLGNYCIDNVPIEIDIDIKAKKFVSPNEQYRGEKIGVFTGPGLMKIEAGSTIPGATDWKLYEGAPGIYLDVDTSAAGFASTPIYITSLGGSSHHWMTTGATSIYNATPTGFRVYLSPTFSNEKTTPNFANEKNWYIQWIGIEQRSCNAGNCIEIEGILLRPD